MDNKELFPSRQASFRFPHRTLYVFIFSPIHVTCHISRPFQRPWFGHTNGISYSAHVMKPLLIMQLAHCS